MIDLGTRRELFVDHFLIDRLDNLELRLQQPVSANRAFTFDAPGEGAFCGYSTVIQDGDRILLYYRAWPDVRVRDKAYAVAESHDGGHSFQRLPIGPQPADGSVRNYVTGLSMWDSFCPFLDTNPACKPDQRYKGLANFAKDGKRGLLALASPDGLHWTQMVEQPVITEGAFDSLNVGFWSAAEGCYVSYFRTWTESRPDKLHNGARGVSRILSDDFIHWHGQETMTYGDAWTEELYTNNTAPYARAPHIYLAFPKRFVKQRQTLSDAEAATYGIIPPYHTEVSDGCFMVTRGGNRYDRTFMEAFLRPGRDPGNWASRTNMSCHGLLQTAADEISIYYHLRYANPGQYLQRFTLRLDGFASLHAPYAGGTMTSKVLRFSGTHLRLNYATSAPGTLRIGLVDADGAALPGHGLEDCDPVWGDRIDHPVTWGGSGDLSALAGTPCRLQVRMTDADLYSLQFAAD